MEETQIVYTNFKDEVMGIRTESLIDMPSMTGAQYEKKVKAYLNITEIISLYTVFESTSYLPKRISRG